MNDIECDHTTAPCDHAAAIHEIAAVNKRLRDENAALTKERNDLRDATHYWQSAYTDLAKEPDARLFADIKTDQEKLDFIKSGRLWETGVIAKALEPELIRVYSELIAADQWSKSAAERSARSRP
jgi:hypothetical protein